MNSRLRTPAALRPGGVLQTAASESPRRWPWLLAAGLLAIGVAATACNHTPVPSSLAEVLLTGERGPGCVRVVIASDQSGSMSEFAEPREQALNQFVNWAPKNLRPDDEIAVIAFADRVISVVDPASATTRPAVGSLQLDGADTLFEPVVAAVAQMPATTCRTALVLLSDGLMSDLTNDAEVARERIRAAGLSDLLLLAPGESIGTPENWTRIYPYAAPTRFDGTDPNETGLAFGHVLASLTDQRLEKAN